MSTQLHILNQIFAVGENISLIFYLGCGLLSLGLELLHVYCKMSL